MTQEQKELLLKDLCARLPFEVKAEKYTIRIDGELVPLTNAETVTVKDIITQDECPGYVIKPYLFPLSSMTEEQKEEFNALIVEPQWKLIDWLNKNHFDYRDRGLITLGLAKNAVGLNIYH